MIDLEAAVERVWPRRGGAFEVLGGGITNHNVKVPSTGTRTSFASPARTPGCSASTAASSTRRRASPPRSGRA